MIHNHKNNKNKYIREIYFMSHPSALSSYAIPSSVKLKNVLFSFRDIWKKGRKKANETTNVKKNVIEEVIALELLCPFFCLSSRYIRFFVCHTSLMMAVFLDMKIMFRWKNVHVKSGHLSKEENPVEGTVLTNDLFPCFCFAGNFSLNLA